MKRYHYMLRRAGMLLCLVLLSAVLLSPSLGSAAPTGEADVFEVMAYVVAPGKEKQFEEAWSAMFHVLKKQSGFVSVERRQDLKEPKLHVDYSKWASRAQYEAAGAVLPDQLRSTFMGTVGEWKYFGLTR